MKLWFRHVVFSWNRTSDQSLIILYRWEARKNSLNNSKVTLDYGTYMKSESIVQRDDGKFYVGEGYIDVGDGC